MTSIDIGMAALRTAAVRLYDLYDHAEIVALKTANGVRQTFRVLPPSSPDEMALLWQLGRINARPS